MEERFLRQPGIFNAGAYPSSLSVFVVVVTATTSFCVNQDVPCAFAIRAKCSCNGPSGHRKAGVSPLKRCDLDTFLAHPWDVLVCPLKVRMVFKLV